MAKYFTVNEFCHTDTNLENTLPADLIDTANYTLDQLDKIRDLVNIPVIISSGYRSFQVNKAVGGVETSQHRKAEAVDIYCKLQHKDFFLKIYNSKIDYDQIIFEGGWVHISFKKVGNRRQALVFKGKGVYTPFKKGDIL